MTSPQDPRRPSQHSHQHDHDCGCGHQHDHDHVHEHDSGYEHDRSHQHARTQHHPQEHVPQSEPVGNAASRVYSGYGIQLSYPGNWTVTEETGPDQTTITVQSPETMYLSISLFQEHPEPESIVESVIEAYGSEYDNIDIYEPESDLLGYPAICRELGFDCLDQLITVGLLAFQAIEQSVLVMFQGEDRELESTRPVIEAMIRDLLAGMLDEVEDADEESR